MIKLRNGLLAVGVAICILQGFTVMAEAAGMRGFDRVPQAASEDLTNGNYHSSIFYTGWPDLSLPLRIGSSGEFSSRVATEGWQDFISEGYAFQISYPDTFLPEIAPDQNALNAGLGVPEGSPVWQFDLVDPVFFEGTNLIEASIVIQISPGKDAKSACSSYKPGSLFQLAEKSLPSKRINDVTYLKDVVEEGVMGGSYQHTSYRTVFQGACYEIAQVVHSKNIGSFQENAVQPFDDQGVYFQLDQVLNEFRLMNVEATFPEVVYPAQSAEYQPIFPTSGEYADGIDVSHWQGDIKWRTVGDAGYSFAFVKSTEGVGWTDSMFLENMNSGPDSGVTRGVYHFARPDLGNTGQEEAEYFLSVAGDYLKSGYLRPVLDLEVRGSLDQAALSAWVLEWMQTVENHSGVAPLLYTNLFYINNYLTNAVTDYELWIAYWTTGCDQTVTDTIPPTGKWDDWAFWQYCVGPEGTVPGITTPIDLDIFNGNEAGLIAYDAASPLWVFLASDTNLASKPYYADITADVNGDAAGLIDYHFWWNCNLTTEDIASVESSCGVLPQPLPGECLADDTGMRCDDMANEVQLTEHTYQEIGDYTAKVIVERESAPPAEDRYQISVVNPLSDITVDPETPGVGDPYTDFGVRVDVTAKPSVDGVVQVDILEDGSLTPLDSACQEVTGDVLSVYSFDLVIPWSTNETVSYTIWARYRPGITCPVADTDPDDLSIAYEIDWHQLTFSDVPFDHPLHAYIQALWNAGYTAGCSTDPLMYCPDLVMNRAQAAVFMLRGQFGADYVPPPEPWDTFADDWSLSDISWAEKWAEGMWVEGLTAGCLADPLMYCPRRELPRVEASVFGLRMKYGMDYIPPDASGTLFADMTDVGYWGTKWAEQAYLDGLLPECGNEGGKPLFCPDDLLDRGWGAYLIVTAKDLPLP